MRRFWTQPPKPPKSRGEHRIAEDLDPDEGWIRRQWQAIDDVYLERQAEFRRWLEETERE